MCSTCSECESDCLSSYCFFRLNSLHCEFWVPGAQPTLHNESKWHTETWSQSTFPQRMCTLLFTVLVCCVCEWIASSSAVANRIIAACRLFQALCSPFALCEMNVIRGQIGATKKKSFFICCSGCHLLVDVIHHSVVTAGCIDFCDDSRCQAVHQFAQNDAIAERFFICDGRETFASHCFDPLTSLELLLWFTFTGNLRAKQ